VQTLRRAVERLGMLERKAATSAQHTPVTNIHVFSTVSSRNTNVKCTASSGAWTLWSARRCTLQQHTRVRRLSDVYFQMYTVRTGGGVISETLGHYDTPRVHVSFFQPSRSTDFERYSCPRRDRQSRVNSTRFSTWQKWSTCRRWQTFKVLGFVWVSRTLPAVPSASQYSYPQHFALECWQVIELAVSEGFKQILRKARGRSPNIPAHVCRSSRWR